MWHKEKLIKALQNNFLQTSLFEKISASQVTIDSRQKTENGLFIALIGENNDGHDYLKSAFENGATIAIVEKIPQEFHNDSRLILVKNTSQALLDLAHYSRAQFQGKIIAVTGSVGKTSIKEMLKTILAFKNKVFATHGNLNNHIGLPLSLCNLPSNCDYAVLEMGMNHLGEIDFLSQIAKPNIAIISNVVAAHIGNFNNEEEIALAKSEILHGMEKNGFAIFNADNKYFDFLKSEAGKNKIKDSHIISFGQSELSQIQLQSFTNLDPNSSQVNALIFGQKITFEINSINQATIFNSLIALAVLTALKENINDYLPAFKQLTIPKGRGNIIKINQNNLHLTIIDDSYNANLTSMIAGLKFLADLGKKNPGARTVAIIGDMLELGEHEVMEHKSIAKYIEELNIDSTLLVGRLTQNIIPYLKKEKIIGHFDSSKDLANQIIHLVKNNDILLVKGSRGTKMELVINKLNEIK